MLRTARERGLSGLAITDHDRWGSYAEAAHIESNEPDPLLLITGIEITTFQLTRGGFHIPHILVLNMLTTELHKFLRRHPYPLLASTQQTLEWVRQFPQAIAIAAHPRPFGDKTSLSFAEIEQYRHLLDAMEVYNDKAGADDEIRWQFATRLGLPMTGGSDAHRALNVGNMATEVSDDIKTATDVVNAIREHRCRPVQLR